VRLRGGQRLEPSLTSKASTLNSGRLRTARNLDSNEDDTRVTLSNEQIGHTCSIQE